MMNFVELWNEFHEMVAEAEERLGGRPFVQN